MGLLGLLHRHNLPLHPRDLLVRHPNHERRQHRPRNARRNLALIPSPTKSYSCRPRHHDKHNGRLRPLLDRPTTFSIHASQPPSLAVHNKEYPRAHRLDSNPNLGLCLNQRRRHLPPRTHDPRLGIQLGMDGQSDLRHRELCYFVGQPSRLLSLLARLGQMAAPLRSFPPGSLHIHLLHRHCRDECWRGSVWHLAVGSHGSHLELDLSILSLLRSFQLRARCIGRQHLCEQFVRSE